MKNEQNDNRVTLSSVFPEQLPEGLIEMKPFPYKLLPSEDSVLTLVYKDEIGRTGYKTWYSVDIIGINIFTEENRKVLRLFINTSGGAVRDIMNIIEFNQDNPSVNIQGIQLPVEIYSENVDGEATAVLSKDFELYEDEGLFYLNVEL